MKNLIGKILGMQIISDDITERKKTKEGINEKRI